MTPKPVVTHPASYPMGSTGDPFPEGKAAGAWS